MRERQVIRFRKSRPDASFKSLLFAPLAVSMIGSRLGNWVLDRLLGQGAAGTVYLAHADPAAPAAPQRAAVKVLAAELAADPGFLGRFEREIEVLGKLDHPNIVKLIDSGRHEGRYYFAMEYVDG